MEDNKFRELFQSVMEHYELDPVVAEQLLRRILEILENSGDDTLQTEGKYEILIEQIERGEL